MRVVSKSKLAKVLGISLVLIVGTLVCLHFWVIPAVIVNQIQSRLEGKVTIRGWWINGTSAGVKGLTIHEGMRLDSPVWLTVDRVATDLTLGNLLCGRFSPTRIKVRAPRVTFRIDQEGHFLNLPKVKGSGEISGSLPSIVTSSARITFRREDRPLDMVVSGVEAKLAPATDGKVLNLSGEARDPYWGHWTAAGEIDLSASTRGKVRFSGQRIITDPETLTRVLFIPTEVWSHVAPTGNVDLSVELAWESQPAPALHTRTVVTLLETSARFPSLELETTQTKGIIHVDDGVVRLESAQGQALGGRVEATGSLDFTKSPAQVALDLTLEKIDVVRTPKSWQLREAEITGLLTGKVLLRALLDPAGVDLSGSSGQAVVEGGTVQGIPVKSLRLAMHAQGDSLRYDAKDPDSTSRRPSPPNGRMARRSLSRHLSVQDDLSDRFADPDSERVRLIPIALVVETPEAQPAQEPNKKAGSPETSEPKLGGFHLPKSITTQIELEDVDVRQLIAKAQYLFGLPFPIPITGRLSLKANATIPLGTLRNVREYVFHGDLTLTGASIAKTDFGRLVARIDFSEGVLELKQLRGLLVDRPEGGPDNPPPPSIAPIPPEGPLPAGGFRCDLRAEISPLGKLTGELEGNGLPLGEIVAPILPRPTPVAGLVSLQLDAATDLSTITNPASWTASGKAESVRLSYRGAALDRVSFDFGIKDSHLSVPRIEAKLVDRPLTGRFELGLGTPYPYNGILDVSGWDLAKLDPLLPIASLPSPLAGLLSVHAESKGTINPQSIETQGQGQIVNFQAGAIPLATVPFRWKTEKDVILISDVNARPFGGQVSAEARVPIVPGKPITGEATVTSLDTAKLSQALPGRDLKLSGKADGQASFVIHPEVRELEADVRLSAPDLVVQGLAAEQLKAVLHVQDEVMKYEVTADSLGGKMKFLGDFPLTLMQGANPSTATSAATGELRAVGFTLEQVWKAMGAAGTMGQLSGRGALNANLRDVLSGNDKGLWARGIVEFRDLNWAGRLPLGQLSGIMDLAPATWRVDPISGSVLGGAASGSAWGTAPAHDAARAGFRVRIDRAALRQVLAPWPEISQNVTGMATIHLTGGLEKTFSVAGDAQLTDARLAGVPISDLHAPAELVYTPETGMGTLHFRHASLRLAGGQIRGEGSFRVGKDRAFQTQIQLTGVDLQTLARINSDAARPSSGRITGRVSLSGPDPAATQRYRGKLDLDLDDASLVNVPVFREIDRFLGAARGGLFEHGDLSGTIANRQLIVESLTLQGRLVQLHATGSVGFDSQLNLEVLINTNQIIPETGQALVGLIPGLRDVAGRREQASLRVANYLANRLLKLRVSGTLKNPSAVIDSSIPVANAAVGFFSGVLKLPLGFAK